MEVFLNVGPGVGIRILALVLLTVLFWPVQADLQRAVASVCSQATRRGIPTPPGFPLHVLLQTVRMAILSDGI